MRPTTSELLEVMHQVFTSRITPLLEDDHAKARAAVMAQIIAHLHTRTRLEGRVLWADNADLTALLEELAPSVPTVDAADALARARAAVPDGEYPSVELLQARNDILSGALVDLMTALDTLPEETRQAADARINTYLRRRLDRELELCALPALGGSAEDLPLV